MGTTVFLLFMSRKATLVVVGLSSRCTLGVRRCFCRIEVIGFRLGIRSAV